MNLISGVSRKPIAAPMRDRTYLQQQQQHQQRLALQRHVTPAGLSCMQDKLQS
jgi:hypothetical protein